MYVDGFGVVSHFVGIDKALGLNYSTRKNNFPLGIN